MMQLPRREQRRLRAAARRAYPREAAGLIFAGPPDYAELKLVPTPSCRNSPISFRIRARRVDRLRRQRADREERLVGCFHSHVLSGARPSFGDRLGALSFGGLWLIYSAATNDARLFFWNGSEFVRRPLSFG